MRFVVQCERENENCLHCKLVGIPGEDTLLKVRRTVGIDHGYMIPDTGFAYDSLRAWRTAVTINDFGLNPKRVRLAGLDVTNRYPGIVVLLLFLCRGRRADEENEKDEE